MKNQAGYSLIELVITIVFIGIAFPGLIAFFVNTMNDSVENQLYTEAIGLAQSKLEEITADKLDDSRGYTYITTGGQYPQETIGLFTRTTTITVLSLAGVEGAQTEVEISHQLMVNDYSLSCFFTLY